MLLMYTDPRKTKSLTAEQLKTISLKHEKLRRDLTQTKELSSGAGLEYPEDTVTVSVRDGHEKVLGKAQEHNSEELTAFYVVECAKQDRAVDIARQILDFHVTRVEVRHIHDSTGIA